MRPLVTVWYVDTMPEFDFFDADSRDVAASAILDAIGCEDASRVERAETGAAVMEAMRADYQARLAIVSADQRDEAKATMSDPDWTCTYSAREGFNCGIR